MLSGSFGVPWRDSSDLIPRCRDFFNGIGISEQNITRILEPFFTSKPRLDGSGLGLDVTNNIVSFLLCRRMRAGSFGE
jgi:C4-dicarboxylate-specific signal transduction histidine kinase